MSAPWPCSTCGAPGIRNIGTRGYCAGHLTELLRRFDAATWAWRGAGVALPAGLPAADGSAPCACSACGATWTTAALSDCPWCLEAAERQRHHQAELTLTPPDVDPDDRTYDAVLRGWADRLAVAARAGVITVGQAERAWGREVADVAA